MKKHLIIFIFLSFNFTSNSYSLESLDNVLHKLDKTITIEITKILTDAEVYPNPAEDYIYLDINDQKISTEVKIEVMSIIGNKMSISSEKIKSGLYKINIKEIPSGHYYVMLTIDSEKQLKKFIKK